MGKAAPARRAAARILGEVRRKEAHARDVLRTSKDMARLDERDRALASRLVLGTIGASGLCDQVIDSHVSARARVEPQVRDVLCMAAYELLFCTTPSSVVVSQGVELVRSSRPRAAGLANAVLRRVAAEDVPTRGQALDRVRSGGTDTTDLASASGYPAWLLERVARERGTDVARAMALSALEAAPVYVATNEARHTARQTQALLQAAGLRPRASEVTGSFVLDAPTGLATSGLVQAADVVVADLSAQRIATLAAPQPGSHVLEIGQGRGTKTILLQSIARRAGGPAHVVGLDNQAFKVEVARKRMGSAGLSRWVDCVAFDACALAGDNLPDTLDRAFDLVFVDAPCSGVGTLRRHPEIAWRLGPADVNELADLQLRMLNAASTRVAPGGMLCYATCSVLRAEDEDVVQAFLSSAEGRGFELEAQPFLSHLVTGGPDGHFCATLSRLNTATW